jgi:hypothetical protein
MENFFVALTLMRNSREIIIDVRKILTWKSIILGSGSIIYLTERLDGGDTLLVDESIDEISASIFKLRMQKQDNLRPNVSF